MKLWLGVFISLNLIAAPRESHHIDQRSEPTRPAEEGKLEQLSSADLKMYLQILDEREKQLVAINQSLLNEANYSFVKIPLFMLKAGIDGYLLGRMMNSGSSVAAAGSVGTKAVENSLTPTVTKWLAQGGVDKLKRFGFDVALLGIATTNDTALIKGYHWEYRIPIYGTARAAYLWSDQLMKSPELIEKNGNEILGIRKEKFRVRSILDHVSFSHEEN